jgi:phage gp29-like protein
LIVDKNGIPISSKRPIQREIAIASVYDKYSTYPSNGLTPVKLAQIFREADQGEVLRQMEMFEEMEEKDTHLFSQLQTRKNAVTGLDFEILPFSDEEHDKRICDFVKREIESIESIDEIFMDLLDAIGKGFAINEIMWAVEDNKVVIKEIKNRHQKKFFWDYKDIFKVMTEEYPMGIELPKNKFIMHRYKARSGHTSRAGLLRVVAWMYLFKNYDVKDWVSFCETFGMPLRLGKYNTATSPEDKAALMEALVRLGTDAAGIISDDTEIEFKESAKTTSVNVYEALAEFCNREMSKAILGQTLTSDSGGGSYAQSKTHNEVRHDLTVADCKALAQTIRRDLIKPLVLFNFSESKRIPKVKFACEVPEDAEKNANTYSILIKDIGLKISHKHLYEKFGIPKPEEGEEVVVPFEHMALKDNTDNLIANKADTDNSIEIKYQNSVDDMADIVTNKVSNIFANMFEPIQKLINESESLEEIKEKLSNTKEVEKIYQDMDSDELEDLIQKSMFFADMLGRMKENEYS